MEEDFREVVVLVWVYISRRGKVVEWEGEDLDVFLDGID